MYNVVEYAIVIPAWNEAAFIDASVSAAQDAMTAVERRGCRGELIVVNNNSDDDTAERAARAGATVVFEPVNQIARARNRGADAASGDKLVFLDADSIISPGLLEAALQRLDSGRVVGGGARLVSDRPVAGFAARGLDLWNAVSRRAQLAAGCFFYCRRDAFDAAGGFDTRVYAGEEILLSRKLKRWGRRNNRQMRFDIVEAPPIITSVRKIDWYTPGELLRQTALVMLPGAIRSKSLCHTWYRRRATASLPPKHAEQQKSDQA